MENSTLSKIVISVITSLLFHTAAIADNDHDNDRRNVKNHCDVVSLNGTGNLLEDGRIVGMETLTIIGKQKQYVVNFEAVPLGVTDVDLETGAITLAASHDFKSNKGKRINFTTFDEISVIPLGGIDTTCQQNPCGLKFKLKLKTGSGRYNCGEIVSGYNTDPLAQIPFTSYADPFNTASNGDTVFLNSIGKLCKCN